MHTYNPVPFEEHVSQVRIAVSEIHFDRNSCTSVCNSLVVEVFHKLRDAGQKWTSELEGRMDGNTVGVLTQMRLEITTIVGIRTANVECRERFLVKSEIIPVALDIGS